MKKQKTCVGCFRMLADNTRVRIIKFLQEGGAQNVSTITKLLNRSQPTISHHLQMLSDNGLVRRERRGKEIIYQFNPNYSCRGCGVFNVPIRT